MKISIITPVYKGNKYLDKLLNNLKRIGNNLPNKVSLEWILINDYPQEKIIPLENNCKKINIIKVSNKQNSGIHTTRVNGLKYATGEYIIFLDQDDKLAEDSINNFLQNINGKDFIIGNGYYEISANKKQLIFKSKLQMKASLNIKTYFYVGNVIISPGMVMIKRTAIPISWTDHSLKNNGSDDWLLWTLMLAEGKKGKVLFMPTYVHVKTGTNASDNSEGMIRSSKEALNVFKSDKPSFKKYSDVYEKRLHLMEEISVDKKNKIKIFLNHPFFLQNLLIYKFKGLL